MQFLLLDLRMEQHMNTYKTLSTKVMEGPMQNKFIELRQKHPVFTYEKYEITDLSDRISIVFTFHLGDFATFTPRWEFLKKHSEVNYEKEEIIQRLAFNLGLVELISYWKCACSPLVKIEAGYVDKEQIDWWKRQYYLGLGEFFYTNGIETSLENFMEIEVAEEQTKKLQPDGKSQKDGKNLEDINDLAYGKGLTGHKGLTEDIFKTDFEKAGCLIPIGGGRIPLLQWNS
jgi:hypothetical protein